MPLLLRAKTNGFFFEVGPQLGYLLAQKVEANVATSTTMAGSSPVVTRDNNTDNSRNGTRKFDVGYVLGVGYQLPQGLEVGVRYNGGISDLADNNDAGGSKSRNSVFQVQVGYLFGGK